MWEVYSENPLAKLGDATVFVVLIRLLLIQAVLTRETNALLKHSSLTRQVFRQEAATVDELQKNLLMQMIPLCVDPSLLTADDEPT